ncbi:MAG: hypothetical protein ACK504_10335 [Bacteroidota bacterium]
MPNFGWNFVAMSPIITTAFSDIARQINVKRINEAQIKSINLKNEVQLNQDLLALNYHFSSLHDKLDNYQIEKLVYQIKLEKFDITEKQYNNKEITPSQYMLAKEEKFLAIQHLKSIEIDIKHSKHLLLETAKQSNWVELPAFKITIN